MRPKSRPEPGTRMSVLLSNPDYLLEGFAQKKCQVYTVDVYTCTFVGGTCNVIIACMRQNFTIRTVFITFLTQQQCMQRMHR